jgi:poly(A)-specific ribonuclease
MEVDHGRFWPQLLSILKNISNAPFVSFDLEMSGIPIRGSNNRPQRNGKPTLQETYEETKEAAQKYQIVQMGITCIEQDHELGR